MPDAHLFRQTQRRRPRGQGHPPERVGRALCRHARRCDRAHAPRHPRHVLGLQRAERHCLRLRARHFARRLRRRARHGKARQGPRRGARDRRGLRHPHRLRRHARRHRQHPHDGARVRTRAARVPLWLRRRPGPRQASEDGRIAGQKADFVIVTSDNPRTEDPEAIIADILPGLKETHTPYVVRPDRREAIAYAIENHCPGDVIILCGKGHEDYQIIGKTKVHMDEREIVAEILEKRKREK